MTLTTVATASADNWGAGLHAGTWCERETSDSECTGDNQFLYVYIESNVPTAMRNAILNSLEHDYTFDNEVVGWEADGPTHSSTDVIIKWQNYDDVDPSAYTTCAPGSTISGYVQSPTGLWGYNAWCKRQELWLDSSRLDDCLIFPCRAYIACHELGHTLGLQHPGPTTRITCMSKNSTNKNKTPDLDGHDREHLAKCYPHPYPVQGGLTTACRVYDGIY